MYSTLKRFLSAITSIAVAFTVTAVPVSAAALSNDSVSAAAGTITEVYVNPLYADVITESDLLSPSQAAGTSCWRTMYTAPQRQKPVKFCAAL